MIRSCSYRRTRWGVVLASLAVLWTAAPRAAWGQSSWPSYPNNSAISVTSGGNVGIGTSNPSSYRLALLANDDNLRLNTPGASQYATLQYADNGVNIWALYKGPDQKLHLFRNGPAVDTMTFDTGGNVGIGTTSPQYKLAVNGTIGAKDVIVTNAGWPDYVFQPGYRLRPLSEVGQYIQANHHLPDIPTEAEVKEKGVSLGDMQAKLLAKVEELTLHLIQQEKENQDLRARLAQLENRVSASGAVASSR